jgi:excisionase family DNA binding protein
MDPLAPNAVLQSGGGVSNTIPAELASCRMSVQEIARRLDIGRCTVYAMLEQGIMPGIRLRRRWIITRHAYEQWERTCGMRARPGLGAQPEVKVLNWCQSTNENTAPGR